MLACRVRKRSRVQRRHSNELRATHLDGVFLVPLEPFLKALSSVQLGRGSVPEVVTDVVAVHPDALVVLWSDVFLVLAGKNDGANIALPVLGRDACLWCHVETGYGLVLEKARRRIAWRYAVTGQRKV